MRCADGSSKLLSLSRLWPMICACVSEHNAECLPSAYVCCSPRITAFVPMDIITSRRYELQEHAL